MFCGVHHLAETDRTSRTARELTLEAAQSAAINRNSTTDYSSKTYSPAHIKKLLDSRHEREVLDGMRRVISVGPRLSTHLIRNG